MKLAVTGCNGSVGQRIVAFALKEGHVVLGLDRNARTGDASDSDNPRYLFREVDLTDYNAVLKAFEGYEGVIHLAAYRNPMDYAVMAHNNNVVSSWNVLRAAAELGITRVAQASSVNVVTLRFSQQPRLFYFPIDEDHPCLPDEPYGLSKVICELQADAIVRRYSFMRVASLRLHWSLPTKVDARELEPEKAIQELWSYVQEDSAAEAFLLAITVEPNGGEVEKAGQGEKGEKDKNQVGQWSGHERFFIVAPEIAHDVDSAELRKKYWPDVKLRDGVELEGRQAFFDCEKAERLLGWVHKDYK